MKKIYEKPIVMVFNIKFNDIITTSGYIDGNDSGSTEAGGFGINRPL